MPASFRRHDSTAQNIPASDRPAYARLKAELIAGNVGQDEVDTRLNAFFWQCFEADDEDEGETDEE
jgi:hypothetical protein